MKIFSVALLTLTMLLTSAQVSAECIPGDDPCAPKKVIGAWVKSAQLGFNQTKGNSETLLFVGGLKASYDDGADIFETGGDYSYGEDDKIENANGDSTTRNDFRGALRYDHLFTERWYAGAGAKMLYDEIADVDYRLNLDPNLGYYLLRDTSFKFRLEGGPSYIFQRVGGEEKDYLAPRLAERFEWAITCTSKLFQQAEVLYDVSDSDNYLINAEIGVEAAISTSLALVFTIRENYDNVPAADREKDDLAVITSLKILL